MRKAARIATTKHKMILRIIPPIPSPTAGNSADPSSKSGTLSDIFFSFSLLTKTPIFSFSFKPKYNPDDIKRKNAPAKIEVEINEFWNNERCELIPENQTQRITKTIIDKVE